MNSNINQIDKQTKLILIGISLAIVIVIAATILVISTLDTDNTKDRTVNTNKKLDSINDDIDKEDDGKLQGVEEKEENIEKYVIKTYNNMTIDNMDEYNELSNFLDEYMNYINKKEYKKAYDMIWDEYLKAKHYTYKSFETLVKEQFKYEMIVNITNYLKQDSYYTCKVKIFPASYGDEETNKEQGKEYYGEYTIIITKNGYKLALERIKIQTRE